MELHKILASAPSSLVWKRHSTHSCYNVNSKVNSSPLFCFFFQLLGGVVLVFLLSAIPCRPNELEGFSTQSIYICGGYKH